MATQEAPARVAYLEKDKHKHDFKYVTTGGSQRA
jgi:hypothetical protein